MVGSSRLRGSPSVLPLLATLSRRFTLVRVVRGCSLFPVALVRSAGLRCTCNPAGMSKIEQQALCRETMLLYIGLFHKPFLTLANAASNSRSVPRFIATNSRTVSGASAAIVAAAISASTTFRLGNQPSATRIADSAPLAVSTQTAHAPTAAIAIHVRSVIHAGTTSRTPGSAPCMSAT